MSRTWARRPRRRNPVHAKQKRMAYELRACCQTHGRDPHLPGCVRHPRMCGDKAAYEKGGSARRHAREFVAAATDGSTTWRAYQCPSCELWHLTTAPALEDERG